MDFVATIREQIDGMLMGAVAILPNLAVALVVLIITWLVAKSAVKIADRITGKTDVREDLRNLTATLVRVLIWIFGLLIAAAVAIPGFTPAGLIAGLGIGALAIGFAFQDIFENFLAGVLIMLRNKMNIGDVIEVEGVLGKVEHITLRETHVRHLSNELTIMPNSMIFKNQVKILTDQDVRRDQIVVGVAYDTDLPAAKAAIQQAVEGLDIILVDRGVDVFAQEFNSSSIDFLVRYWTQSRPRDLRETKSEVVFTIKQALDDAGIEIPFPYITHTFKEPVPLVQ
ncbi:mechanosensitive ion channel family protein [Alteraurantiacibacter aquimixticola]|uniref:Small-conductance mechanosensitive channel n=1 Tax=Alteraurantiacibacter aquimixticola TaxID=2489173 RepID=A0A4T3F3N0_9SPHN|nr:mechanosensitive ion channel family protein [Alteraurantiacibacter aquimixticola]TIX51875.1 mechanosensitive ion channel family protein [Alteraurantiacibacter aquimixticola]